jgi:AIPR protein
MKAAKDRLRSAMSRKFIRGFNDLLVPRFDRFNEKIRSKSTAITAALDNTAVRFELVLAHSGQQSLSIDAQTVIDDLLRDINDVSDIVTFHYLGQAQIHAIVRQGVTGPSPDLAVTLHDWGATEEPYRAFYGQVDAADVAEWWDAHRDTLFDRNLRKFIHDSSVNAAITSTLLTDPSKFWYFNNGITVLCNRVQKSPAGGSSRRSGKFVFDGATVVNGAQTVGSIGRAAELDPSKVSDARVHIRFISLEHCPPDFATEVTRATNTQNRVERRDFVAIDPEQERLRTDLLLEQGKTYAIKTGEPDPARGQGCTVVEATIALACAHSSDLAVQAKREIGRLWEDVTKPPYKLLFNGRVTATRLWRAVEILRAVDDTLRNEQDLLEGRDRSVAVHGNRLIAHAVFASLPPSALSDAGITEITPGIPELTRRVLSEMQQIIERDYSANVLAALFKNASRCREVIDRLPDLT